MLKLTLPLFISLLFISITSQAQDEKELSWLKNYTESVVTGSSTRLHKFYSVEGKDCKLKFVEEETDKKGNTETQAYIFYLADMNTNAISFKPTGNYITINMEAKASQDYIMEYENGEFEGYVSDFDIYTDAVDKARNIIDAIKAQQSGCQSEGLTWSTAASAVDWLSSNIGTAVHSDDEVSQSFEKTNKPYLAKLSKEYTDSKGESHSETSVINLSDLDPKKIDLDVSGKDLTIELNIKEGKKYIECIEDGEKEAYDDELEIYAGDLEQARNIILAFESLVPDIKAEYKKWGSSSDAIAFVQNTLWESNSSIENLEQSWLHDAGLITLTTKETDSKGGIEVIDKSCYLADLRKEVQLDVSGSEVSITLETKNNDKYIKVVEDGEQQSYDDEIEIAAKDIETARELINALDYIIANEKMEAPKLSGVSQANDLLKKLATELIMDGENVKQQITVDAASDNKISFDITEGVEQKLYEIYPEDLKKGGAEVKVSGDELYVVLSTGKNKYIAVTENGTPDSYIDDFNVYFDDTRKARDFKAAVEYLSANYKPVSRDVTSIDQALAVLQKLSSKIQIGDESVEQKVETVDDKCKLKVTAVETESDGDQTEMIYEFILADIDAGKTSIEISGETCSVELNTKESAKLIKPYENGEPENFIGSFEIVTSNVLEAKKIREAIKTAAVSCK